MVWNEDTCTTDDDFMQRCRYLLSPLSMSDLYKFIQMLTGLVHGRSYPADTAVYLRSLHRLSEVYFVTRLRQFRRLRKKMVAMYGVHITRRRAGRVYSNSARYYNMCCLYLSFIRGMYIRCAKYTNTFRAMRRYLSSSRLYRYLPTYDWHYTFYSDMMTRGRHRRFMFNDYNMAYSSLFFIQAAPHGLIRRRETVRIDNLFRTRAKYIMSIML